jgi:hypothetical protein
MNEEEMPAQEKTLLEINEYHKLEIEEIFLRTRTSENVRTQVAILCITANITVMGFAFSNQKAGLVFAAASILLLWALADAPARRNIGVLYYRGLQLEKRYAPDKENAFLHIYVAATASKRGWVEQLSAIENIQNHKERIRALRLFRFSVLGILAPIIIMLLEVALGFILFFSGWLLF